MAEVEVVGIRVLEDNDQPVMVLRVVGSTRYLPVWVDTVSAAALMSVVGGELEGPALTFDLFSKLLSRLGDPALSGRCLLYTSTRLLLVSRPSLTTAHARSSSGERP